MKAIGRNLRKDDIGRFVVTTFLWQTLNLVFFAIFTEYDINISVKDAGVGAYYPFFQDVHVMMFVGFGFLLVFPSLYSLSAVILNFLLSAMVIQWSILTIGFWDQIHLNDWKKIQLNIPSLINADFAVAAVLISFSGVLGKLTPTQLLGMAFFETIFYSLNLWLGVRMYCAVDMGGSMFIHAFGAYFGLAVSYIVDNKVPAKALKKSKSSYQSDLFAMIGTLFLWMFWPSFNGALAHAGPQHRVIINTVLSLCGSCAVTFLLSMLFHGKLEMVDIQNASLAGGVAVGSSADLVIGAWGAILIGSVAGGVSTFGYKFLTPWLEKKFGLHDTAGIHNLHGMPGIIGGLAGIFSSLSASKERYGESIGVIFPCRATSNATLAESLGVAPGKDWESYTQASFQAAALFTSIGIGLTSGIAVGAIIKNSCFASPKFERKHYFTEYSVNVGDDYPAKEAQADVNQEAEKKKKKRKVYYYYETESDSEGQGDVKLNGTRITRKVASTDEFPNVALNLTDADNDIGKKVEKQE